MYCNKCGAPNKETARFCCKCGSDIEQPAAEPQPYQSYPPPPPAPTYGASYPAYSYNPIALNRVLRGITLAIILVTFIGMIAPWITYKSIFIEKDEKNVGYFKMFKKSAFHTIYDEDDKEDESSLGKVNIRRIIMAYCGIGAFLLAAIAALLIMKNPKAGATCTVISALLFIGAFIACCSACSVIDHDYSILVNPKCGAGIITSLAASLTAAIMAVITAATNPAVPYNPYDINDTGYQAF